MPSAQVRPSRTGARRGRSSSPLPRSHAAARGDELRRTGYPFLVRCLANLSVLVSDTPDGRGALRDARAGALRRRTRSRRRRADLQTCSAASNPSRRRGSSSPTTSSPTSPSGWDGDESARQMVRGPRSCARSAARTRFPARGDPAAARFAAGATALRDRRPLLRERERRATPVATCPAVPDARRPVLLDEASGVDRSRPACHR